MKPLGIKNYGSIPHLPGSRIGPGDHHVTDGQARICCEKARDKYDTIIVQEKLDGSNVGVARINGAVVALTRAGYLATSSPYEQHHRFATWVEINAERFLNVLRDGERLAGEWLMQAHGTRYRLHHEPFVVFDLMRGMERALWDELSTRCSQTFITPALISYGPPCPVELAMHCLGPLGAHGALDPVEGAVWRVERNREKSPGSSERVRAVDFLAKYVRHDKADGCFLPFVTGNPEVWNEVLQ